MRSRGPARELAGAAVVITGASSGIGRAAARAFAERGADVAVAARSAGGLDEVADDCRAAGVRAVPVVTDVADEAAVRDLAQRAAGSFGRIDVWVNNAGVMAYGRFEVIPADVHRRVIETNLLGQVHGARAALPYFRRQGCGVLVNVASLYGKITSPLVSPYVTSKFGVVGFSEVLRQELADEPGISVCTVVPGSVDTAIFQHAANYTGRAARPVPPVADPRRVVRAIIRCAQHPQAQVTVGQTGRLFALAHATMPRLYDALVPHVMARTGLGRQPVTPGPGNVFKPVPRSKQVTGGWRRTRRRWLWPATLVGAGVLLPAAMHRLSSVLRGGHAA